MRKFVVLWILVAYLEYLKLTLLRFKAHYSDNKRDMYSDDSEVVLRLDGGGFEKFNELEKKVYENSRFYQFWGHSGCRRKI